MEFPLSRAVSGRFEYLPETGSTNDVLVEHSRTDAAAWPDLSVVVTDNQTRGRGRLGRTWLAPTGKSLAISVLLRPGSARRTVPVEDAGSAGPTRPERTLSAEAAGPALPADRYGWLPLLAGAAMTLAVRDIIGELAAPADPSGEQPRHDVTLKWPNDVLIDGYKVCGVLCELLPGGDVVVGAGLNVSLDEHDLPTLTSTSLLLVTGTAPDPDAVLARYLTRLQSLCSRFLDAGGDPVASGLHDEVAALCGTLGTAVRVELPGGDDLVGTAMRLDDDGRLVVRDQADGELLSVAAGDVTHLRY